MCWPPEDKALITSPSADNDLLILCASFSWLPIEPDFFTLSEPARSTKLSCKLNPTENKLTIAIVALETNNVSFCYLTMKKYFNCRFLYIYLKSCKYWIPFPLQQIDFEGLYFQLLLKEWDETSNFLHSFVFLIYVVARIPYVLYYSILQL